MIQENMSFWSRLLDMLQNQFGDQSEIVLHDLTGDYSHSIIDIRNGYITGRKVGDPGSNLGLEVLRGTVKDGDRYNYVVNLPGGRLLRSSTMFIRDENGNVVGSLCINTDITETVRFEDYLRRYNRYTFESAQSETVVEDNRPPQNQSGSVEPIEVFASDVNQVLDYLMNAAQKNVGIPPEKMKRADKIKYLKYLDDKGAFLITKSSEKVYEYLRISKYTFYNYLDAIHNGEVE